ncbi:MAG: diguanylate cyclase [Betaproteobacteria bacterium]|nr:diguanylate cyclase [Betaproteobacteria bacterium]
MPSLFDITKFEQLKATGDLPSPRGVALAIIHATQGDDVSMTELARIIKSDPAFVSRLTKEANSLVGLGVARQRSIIAVQEALTVLGLSSVRNLALGFSLLSNYRRGAAGFDYERFWSASLLCAIGMQTVTRRTRVAPADEAYCVGLLCRIGELALATVHPEQYGALHDEVLDGNPDRLVALERERFAMDHRELSAAMLADWGFPKVFTESVFAHEALGEAVFSPVGREAVIAESLVLVRRLADFCLAEEASQPALAPLLIEAAARLSIDVEALSEISDHVVAEWTSWGSLLQLKTRVLPPFASLLGLRLSVVTANVVPHPPLAVEPPLRREPEEESAVVPAGPKSHLRILVVEADPDSRRQICEILESVGHKVEEAETARQAAEQVLLFLPHLMIVDWTLPDGSGLEVVERLRQIRMGRRVYVLVLTGGHDEQHLVEAFESGVDDFMSKPVNPRVLLARLRAAQRVVNLHQEIEQDRDEMRNFAAELAVSNRRLQEVALLDALTGFPNRRYFMDRVEQEWAVSNRNKRPLSCMVIDIDQFKQINDTYGHDVGDAVLKYASTCLKRGLRAQDVIARTGGDEFVVLCPDTTVIEAEYAAERVRRTVESEAICIGELCLKVTVSIGVADCDRLICSPDALVKAADQGLYAAKQAGRNRIGRAPVQLEQDTLPAVGFR